MFYYACKSVWYLVIYDIFARGEAHENLCSAIKKTINKLIFLILKLE